MEAKIGGFFESVSSFFSGRDQIPWCNPDVISSNVSAYGVDECEEWMYNDTEFTVEDRVDFRDVTIPVDAKGCEKEVTETSDDASDELKGESIMRLSWALVHSRRPDDVQRGIAMLEASLANTNTPLQKREKLYLLAVGYYRSGEFSRSRQLVEQCLEIAPDWRQALFLKNTVEDQITKDGVIGIGITATVVGLIAGGLAAALARRN